LKAGFLEYMKPLWEIMGVKIALFLLDKRFYWYHNKEIK